MIYCSFSDVFEENTQEVDWYWEENCKMKQESFLVWIYSCGVVIEIRGENAERREEEVGWKDEDVGYDLYDLGECFHFVSYVY